MPRVAVRKEFNSIGVLALVMAVSPFLFRFLGG
jgi:hypothetical protein